MRRVTVLGTLLVAACGGGGGPTSGPVPGVLEVVMLGPAANTGAILFDLAGGGVDSVVGTGGYTISGRYTGVERRVAVAGDSLHGTIARVYVPDIHAGHHATVVEVADGADFQLMDPAAYRLPLIARAD